MRTIAVGDIHGSLDLLIALVNAIAPTTTDHLVFLGDYIDRGPDSRGVVAYLLNLHQQPCRTTFLLGNHELMMMRARTDISYRKLWLEVGGAQALASYGTRPGRSGTLDDVPESHWHFLETTCVDWLETDTTVFVHAGLDPNLPMEEQTESALFWEFLKAPIVHPAGKRIICGHTSQRSGQILDLGSTLCIDTHAYASGHLTGLNSETLEFWQTDLVGRVQTGLMRDPSAIQQL